MNLRMFFQWILPKIPGQNSTYMPKFYNDKVISTTNIWITNDVRLFYILPMLTKVKIKSRISFPHRLTDYIFSELKRQQCFSDFNASEKEISKFQNPFNWVQLGSFRITFYYKWLIWNIMTCKRKIIRRKI